MTRNLIVFHVFIGSQKMHKIPSVARFIIAGKTYINKQLTKHITSAFKLCYNQTDAYHKKKILVGPKPFA